MMLATLVDSKSIFPDMQKEIDKAVSPVVPQPGNIGVLHCLALRPLHSTFTP